MKKVKPILALLLVAVFFIGMIPMSTVPALAATNLTSSQIKSYVESRVGQSYTKSACLAFVKECFVNLGGPVSTACCAYKYGSSHIVSTSRDNIPIGADVFFGNKNVVCSTCGNYCGHIGIYVGNGEMVHASGGKVLKTSLSYVSNYRGWGYHGGINIVNESATSTPYNISISANTYSVGVGDTVTFNYSIAGATSKSIGIDRAGGSRYKTIVVSDDSGSVSYTFTEPGLYCCITEGKNAKGYNCCDGVYIRVIDTVPQNISISSNYSSVAVGDTVTFKYSITGATGKCIGIDHAGGSRYKTIGVSDDSGTVSYSFTEPGLYCCITEGYNSKGYNCCDGVYIRVIDTVPQNISISSNLSSVAVGDTVTFKYSITGATDKCIGIDHAGGSRYKTILVPDDSGTVSYSFTEPGLYCCITEGINAKGYNCCDGVYINVFDPNFNINFNANGGLCTTTSKKVTYGAPFGNLPIPTRSGYTFEGWYTNSVGGTKIKASDIVNNTTEFTLYAHWKANAYTVSYNVNGGTGSIASQTKTHNTNLTLTTAKPTGKSFTVTYNANGGTVSTSSKTVAQTFTNWNTAANGNGTTYNAGATYSANASVTLYAQYANPSIGSLPTPTRSGYGFDGWYTAATGGTKITDSTKVTANTTIYAHWTKNAEAKAVVKDVKIEHNATLNYKSTYMLSPEITADKGTKYKVKYESSDTDVATVDENGKVYAAKKGNATITCTVTDSYENVVTDKCNVNVDYSGAQWFIIIVLFGWIWYI